MYLPSICYMPSMIFYAIRYTLLSPLTFLTRKNLKTGTVQQNRSLFVKRIVTQFVSDLEYSPENPIAEDNVTYQTLRNEFAAYNTGPWFDVLCRESATMADLPYSNLSDEVRAQIARFTWFIIYIDDLGQKFPQYIMDFQRRVITQDTTPQGDFLVAYHSHFLEYYRLFDPIPANCINLSAMDFLNGCLLEQMLESREIRLTEAPPSWPYYLRTKTGSAQSYAFMIFPKEVGLPMSTYIHVIDDITLFTNMVNDILSFYKEDLAGERNNYMYNRACATGRPVEEILQNVIDDTLSAHSRVTKILESTGTVALSLWKQFVNGYIGFHFAVRRYRLHELYIVS